MKRAICIMVLATTLCTTARSQQSESQKLQSSIGIEYFTKKPKEGNNLSVDLTYKHLVVGGTYKWTANSNDGENGLPKTKNTQGFDLHIGGNYRYFIGGDLFYIEGRLIAGYSSMAQKRVVGTRTEIHTSGFGRIEETNEKQTDIWMNVNIPQEPYYAALMPRIGLNFNSYSIYAGAGWNFVSATKKFKKFTFDDKFDNYFFTIGIAKLF